MSAATRPDPADVPAEMEALAGRLLLLLPASCCLAPGSLASVAAIFGIFDERRDEKDLATAATRMAANLSDYGPGRALWTKGTLAFGAHSWPDHGEGALVLDDEAGLALVADIRLDDRTGLCDALGIRANIARAMGDAELLLDAYKRWGEQCAEHLTGDYAFVMWDARRGTLICFRDPVGARPFYYVRQGATFAFSSAVEAVLAPHGITAELDDDVVATLLIREYQWEVAERTCFKAVRRLAPGHAMVVKGRDARSFRHWQPDAVPEQRLGAPDAYAEALLERIKRAIEDRMRGGPVTGAHLSGGLDSSAVAVLAGRHARRFGSTVPTFTWLPPRPARLPNSWLSAYSKVDAVRKQEGFRVIYSPVSSKPLIAFLLQRDAAYPRGQLVFADDCVFGNAAKEGVRVLLTGTMGDEFASCDGAGFESHLLLTGRWGALLRRARDEGVGVFKWAATETVEDCNDIYTYLKTVLAETMRRHDLVNPALRPRVKLPPRPTTFSFRSVRGRQLWFLRSQLYAYRFESMAAGGAIHGVECRHPLADRRVIEFALGLPPDIFRRQGQKRWLMRRALRFVLPEQVLKCPSKADPAHMDSVVWALVECLPELRERIATAPLSRSHYVDVPHVCAVLGSISNARQVREHLKYIDVLRFLDF